MKGFYFEARYDVSGSSFRINLGAGFAPLLLGEGDEIKAFFKVLDGCFEMFYKQDEKARYPPQINKPDYGRGVYYCPSCMTGYYKADRCPNCGIITKKKSRKNNGNKPRIEI